MKSEGSWGRLDMKYKETEVGIMPESWEVKPIKEVTEVVTDYVANGSFASLAENVKYKDEPDEAVLIRLVDYNNDFNGNFVFIDSHAYEFLAKSKLYGGEIIISNVGANVGTVFRCPTLKYKMSLAPNAVMVKFKENDDFYFHWLRGHNGQSTLKSIVTGSAQPKFNKTNFREMLVPAPPIDVQDKIASLLNTIDEKIEINKSINKNLETQVSIVFDSWFVDFSQSEGVCPSNWNWVMLSDFAEVLSGKRPPVKSANQTDETPIPIVGAASVMGYTSEYNHSDKILVTGRVGTHGVVQRFNSPCWTSDNTLIITSKYYEFTNQILRRIDYSSMNRGSTQPLITQGDLKKVPVLLPDLSTLIAFEEFASTLMNQYEANLLQNKRLAELRDSLLPKLMSGEIDVSDIVL